MSKKAKKTSLWFWFCDNSKNFVMPLIQRDFVWKERQIINLFDSIYEGYFIGMFYIWKPENSKDLQYIGCWGLLKDFKDGDEALVEKLSTNEEYMAILDGQQRLTSLNIGIYGTFNNKELYFNKKLGNFKFFKRVRENEKDSWIKVYDIIERKVANLSKLEKKLYDNFQNAPLRIYEVKGDINMALEYFRRINKSGTPLSNALELLSRLSKEWGEDGRKGIKNLREKFKENGISISYDFIMKSYLFLMGKTIKFKIKIKQNEEEKKILENIEENKEKLNKALIKTSELLKDLGFRSSTISSNNALIPIAYMFYKNKKKDVTSQRKEIEKYLYISFFKKIYGRSSDETLNKIRKKMGDNADISKLLKSEQFEFNETDINNILKLKKSIYTKIALKLIYNLKSNDIDKDYDDDHMHCAKSFKDSDTMIKIIESETKELSEKEKEKFKNSWKDWNEKKDELPNLQPLTKRANRDYKKVKTLLEWAKEDWKEDDYKRHLVNKKAPDCLYLSNFDKFFNDRKKKMKEILLKYFDIKCKKQKIGLMDKKYR